VDSLAERSAQGCSLLGSQGACERVVAALRLDDKDADLQAAGDASDPLANDDWHYDCT
jgi:hypothetical protein